VVIWYIVPNLVCFDQEKSGNPGEETLHYATDRWPTSFIHSLFFRLFPFHSAYPHFLPFFKPTYTNNESLSRIINPESFWCPIFFICHFVLLDIKLNLKKMSANVDFFFLSYQ
jgi:hypothetical protein